MSDHPSILVYFILFGYLAALIFAFARWRGLQQALQKHAKTLIGAVVAAMVIAIGGVKVFLAGLVFAVLFAFFIGMIAGPFGFVLGLFLGFGAGVLIALSPSITLP